MGASMKRTVFVFADTSSTGVEWAPCNIGGFGDENVLNGCEAMYKWGTVSRMAIVLWEGVGNDVVVWHWERT